MYRKIYELLISILLVSRLILFSTYIYNTFKKLLLGILYKLFVILDKINVHNICAEIQANYEQFNYSRFTT